MSKCNCFNSAMMADKMLAFEMTYDILKNHPMTPPLTPGGIAKVLTSVWLTDCEDVTLNDQEV